MADFDQVATNEDIAAVADAIRGVTRSEDSMTIPEMPERLTNIRVVVVQDITLETAFDSNSNSPIPLFEIDATKKHLFEVVPVNEAAVKAFIDQKVSTALLIEGGWLKLQRQGSAQRYTGVSIVVTDTLLSQTAETQGYALLPSGAYKRLVFEAGEGKDSAALVAIRTWDEDAHDWLERKNMVLGDYSVSIGSRNYMGEKASEALSVGGLIEHYGQNGLSVGYRVEVRANQSITGGYRVVNKASESIQVGNRLEIDGTITVDEDGNPKSDSRYNAQFGSYNTAGIASRGNIQAGQSNSMGYSCEDNAQFGNGNTVGNRCKWLDVSGKGHVVANDVTYARVGGQVNTIGAGCGWVDVFGDHNILQVYVADTTIRGYDHTVTGGTSSQKRTGIYMFGNECTNNGHDRFYGFGKGLRPLEDDQIVVGAWNAGVQNCWFEIGCGSDNSHRKTAFAVCQQSTNYWIMLGTTRLARPASDGTIATQEYVTGIVGDINSALDAINGEVV